MPGGRMMDCVYAYVRWETRDSSQQNEQWRLLITHGPQVCDLEPLERNTHCPVHRPSPNHMADWPFLWDNTERSFNRVCEHRLTHPDFDHLEWMAERFGSDAARHQSIHVCDGCCERIFP